MIPIDAVITWVDGNDPVLKKKRDAWLTEKHEDKSEDIAGPSRYSSSGELFFCVASILKFATFIRRIFIVTDGQDPHLDNFLRMNFPDTKTEIRIIDHTDIFKGYEQYLPTFNSLAIETMLYRIPDLSEYFINELKRTQDPRLCLIATRCDNPAAKWGDEGFDYGDSSDPDKLIGMPVGYETGDGNWSIKNAPGYPGESFRSYYALPNRLTYARPDVPTMWVTASETQLLLAEAALRGWISGSAEDYYKKGVTAAMQQFSLYPAASDLYAQWITDANISAYLAANPMGTGEDAYKNINWQYYVTTFCDEYETFANWRRSGYPELTPVNKNYPSCETNGEIIRRFRYPINEQQINNANYNAAVERMGGDTFMTRVWWDGGK